MFAFFKNLLASKTKLEEAQKRIIELEAAVQTLKLDLEDAAKERHDLKETLSLQNKKQESELKGMLSGKTEKLLSELAAPLAQLATQSHLAKSRELKAKDVLAVSMRLVESLEQFGLKLEGEIGQSVDFDCCRHESLSLSAPPPDEGRPVIISMPGVSFENKLLKKIAVHCQDHD